MAQTLAELDRKHDAATAAKIESLSKGSRLYEEQLAAQVFQQRIRRDAKLALEKEEREAVTLCESDSPKLVYEPLPTDTPELIPGLLPESGTAAIVGETETGKSLIACEIASSLLTGQPLWGEIEPTRKVNKVVYVLGEHTCVTLQGLFHRTKLPHEGNFFLIGPEHLHPHKALVIGGVQQQIAVERLVKWTEGANLIVFDPLAGFVQGLSSEQDNAAMRTLIDAMSYIADVNKSACLILSHMGKPRIDDSGNEVRRNSYAMRGASAQEDALTHVFYLRKATLVKQQKEERYELTVRKFKGNPSNDSFLLRRDPETKRNTLINVKAKKDAFPSREEKLAIAAKVHRILESNPKFNTDTAIRLIAEAEGVSQATLERILSSVA